MFELFTNAPLVEVGVMKPQEWPFIQRGFNKNIDKVMDYHKTYPKAVKSNHFLVRLLQSIGVPKSLELERYYASVDSIAMNVSMLMKMTSPIYKGYFHKGTFYGNDSPELLIATDDYFDFEEVDRNWMNVSAITPLLHPKSDLDIHIPNGEAYSAEAGLSVILINIPMLAVQYRAFKRAQRLKEFPKPITQFIGGYVLPNMLYKQMDLCLFNRLTKKFYDINDGKNVSFRNHSFVLSSYDSFIDLAIVKILKNITKTNLRFDVALKQIPSFYNEDIYATLMLPDMAPTSQVAWSLVLTRLSTVSFLFDLCKDNLKARNQSTINQILRSFRQNNTYQMLDIMLPDELYVETQVYIDNILDAVHRNTF